MNRELKTLRDEYCMLACIGTCSIVFLLLVAAIWAFNAGVSTGPIIAFCFAIAAIPGATSAFIKFRQLERIYNPPAAPTKKQLLTVANSEYIDDDDDDDDLAELERKMVTERSAHVNGRSKQLTGDQAELPRRRPRRFV